MFRRTFTKQSGYFHAEMLTGFKKAEVKCCTPGVTVPMVSLHVGTVRDAWRALHMHGRSTC